MTTISVIIPTLNEEHYIPRLLHSLAEQNVPIDVFVIDAQSDDATKSVVNSCASLFSGGSSLSFVESPERGISFQRNYGAKLAKGELLLFLDADVVMPRGALQRMIGEFQKRDLCIGTAQLHPDEPDLRGSAIFLLGRIFQRVMLLRNSAYFAGSCTLCRADSFRDIGGYDKNRKVGEDIDLSLRMSEKGRAGLLHVWMPASMRRFKKYGYLHVFGQWFSGISHKVLGLEERVDPAKYPFGEYNRQ